MNKEMAVIILGALTIVSPYLGIPSGWRTIVLVVIGLALMIIGFLLRNEMLTRSSKGSGRGSYVEHTPNRPGTASVMQDYSEPVHKDTLTSLN